MKNILLIVDPQNDFITGTLAVGGAPEKMMKLRDYIEEKGKKYDHIYVTLDSHPEEHCSFNENGGQWPAHCVTWSLGWDIPMYLNDVLNQTEICSFCHKGTEPDKEEYSIFDNCEDGYILSRQLKELMKDDDVYIDICGIAGDYCVLETLKGLVNLMGNQYISVLDEFTASIDGGEKLEKFVYDNNINVIYDADLNLEDICISKPF